MQNQLESGIHTREYWDRRFRDAGDQFVFGKQPDDLARLLYGFHLDLELSTHAELLDLGTGEGRDAVYLASKGFAVTAVDSSDEGLRKARGYAAECGVRVSFHRAGAEFYGLDRKWPVIYANNVLQFLGEAAVPRLHELQLDTAPNGWMAVSVFTDECLAREDHPDLYIARPGELKASFRKWKIFYYAESVLFKAQRGHYLSFAKIIARKTP